jgi:hypothetical protein
VPEYALDALALGGQQLSCAIGVHQVTLLLIASRR